MKNTVLTFLIFICFLNIYSQENFRYFVGTSNPDPDWKELAYNDSLWSQGYGSIGYGDNDDTTLIDTTSSVFIRHHFSLTKSSLKSYEGIILYPDFDDGFICYLNGIEILRVNIGDSIVNPDNLQTTNRSHEAVNYRRPEYDFGYHPLGYFIDSLKLAECNIDTTNVLAFALFNDSTKGSDLSFYFQYAFLDSAFELRDYCYALHKFDSTELPIIVIETNEFGVSENSCIAKMGIINNSNNQFNRFTDNYTDYNGRISLKYRGTSSLEQSKKSYTIELQDSLGNNNNVSLLGMPKENDWVLYAPVRDNILIKNVFTYILGRKMGYYTPRTRFCELVLNGNDMGLYVLTEKIKRDKNRINITKMDNSDNSGINVTGGYILEYKYELGVIYPKPEDITTEQENYINSFIYKCDSLISNLEICNPDSSYKKLIDINSLVDYLLINQLSSNFDSFSKSWYMYKDNDWVDGRLKYGPLWDYDVAWCYNPGMSPEGWRRINSKILNTEYFFKDSSFTNLFINKWNKYRKGIFSSEYLTGLIDSLTNSIAPSIERNYQIWPIFFFYDEDYRYNDWVNEVKDWIEARLFWIDNNINDISSNYYYDYSACTNSYNNFQFDDQGIEITNCYPNPFVDELNINLYSSTPDDLKICIYDLVGIELFNDIVSLSSGESILSLKLENINSPGFYTLRITRGNELVHSQKIVKTN